MKTIITIIATAFITTIGTYQVIQETGLRGELSDIQFKLKKIAENQELMREYAVDKYEIDNLSTEMKGADCGPLANTVNLEDGTIYGVSIDAKAENFLKIKCARSAHLAHLKNTIDQKKSDFFGLKISSPINSPLSSSPYFWISSKKGEDGKVKREIIIRGTNSGNIYPIGFRWGNQYVKDFDDALGKPELISDTELSKRVKGEDNFLYHTRMYRKKYGCVIVDFGLESEKFEYQTARRIILANSTCESQKNDHMDKSKPKFF